MVKQRNEKTLAGVIPALITPVHENGKIDFKLLEKQASYLSSSGINGLFIGSTTGEGPGLSGQQKLEIFEVVRGVVGKKQILCAACIQSSTRRVIDEIRSIESLEPDFVVAVTPFYYTVSQDVIIRHYREIALSSPFPVIVYNIPQCTHNKIELDAILKIAHIDNICGIKDSSGDFISFTRGLRGEVPDSFSWIQGEDYLDGPSLILGAQGLVTGLGNVWIEPYVEIYKEAKRGNISGVNEFQNKIDKLYGIIGVTGGKAIPSIKAAASILGRSKRWMLTSSLTLDNDEIELVKQVLEELELV